MAEIIPPKKDATHKRRRNLDPLIALGVGGAAGFATANPAVGIVAAGITAAALGGREGYRQARMEEEERNRKKRTSSIRHPGRAQTSRTLANARR